jgi:hypothetical protein
MSDEPNAVPDEDSQWRADVTASLMRIEGMLKQIIDQQLLPENPERGLGH